MSEVIDDIKEVPKEREDGLKFENGRFAPGTARPANSGKKAGTLGRLAKLREFADKLAFDTVELPNGRKINISDPAELLMYVAMVGRDPLEAVINTKLGDKSPFAGATRNYIDVEGNVRHTHGFVDLDLRLDCAVKLLPFMRPKLASTEVTGKDGKDLFGADAKTARELSNDPEIRKLFEAVQEKMVPASVSQDSDE